MSWVFAVSPPVQDIRCLSKGLDEAFPSCWNNSFPRAPQAHGSLLQRGEGEHGWQELGGSAPWGCWSQAPGVLGVTEDRGMGRWAAAQGVSLGADTLFWHLQGVARPLIAEQTSC